MYSEYSNIVYCASVKDGNDEYTYYGVSKSLKSARLRHMRNEYRVHLSDSLIACAFFIGVSVKNWDFSIVAQDLKREDAFRIKARLVRGDKRSINTVYKYTTKTQGRDY